MVSAKPPAMSKMQIEPSDHAPHVLVVDDDRRLRELLGRFLAENGYRVTTASHAAEARAKIENIIFDALVLDIMMPGESGLELARSIRQTSAIPILMLTAKAEANDRITGLETGADDYLPKPFVPRELLLRLGNILKRTIVAPAEDVRPESIRFGPFSFRFDRGELRKDDELIHITEREREILIILGSQTSGEVSREALSGNDGTNERTVDVQINRLRRKIEADPANPVFLQTVRGIGYRLVIDR